MITLFKKTCASFAAISFSAAMAFSAAAVQAGVINTLEGDVTHLNFDNVNYTGKGSVDGDGFTWSSTNKKSVYSYNRVSGLHDNGHWNGRGENGAYIGLRAGNDENQFMTITFDDPMASVLAFMNYKPLNSNPYMAIYDVNNLIELAYLRISTPGGNNQGEDWGFSLSANVIKSFVLGNAHIVAANLHTGQVKTAKVPEPQSAAILALGLLGLIATRRMQKS